MRNSMFYKQLEESGMIHRPLPLDEAEYFENNIKNTVVNAFRVLDECNSLDFWEVDRAAQMSISSDYLLDENQSIKFISPTRFDHWPGSYARIYYTPYLTRIVNNEDWTDFDRISLSIRPEMPGFKFVSLHIQLVNEGDEPVPDRYEREGCHNINLKNHEWNHVSIEIPNVARDKITAFKIGYDMVGNETEAVDHACFYFSHIKLEKLEKTAKWIGWEPEQNEVIFCGTGYQTGSIKRAIAHHSLANHFKVVDANTGKVVFESELDRIENEQGKFAIMDFSEVKEEGNYLLVCGETITRTFPIADNVWENSIWKTINLFFAERCGYEVPGVHKYCHGNVLNHHGDKSVVANGGWHDAADMSQNLTNTAEGVYSFFQAAINQKDNVQLFERLIEEGKWGLDWMLRTRFGDGYRTMGSGGSVWTSNIIGSCDQMNSEAQNLAIENFMASAAEALAAVVLKDADPEQSRYLKQVAKEDWGFAYEKIDFEEYTEAMDPARVSSPVLLYSVGVLAACHIYETDGDVFYLNKAIEISERVMACQQLDYPDWDIPMTGFFYRDEKKDQIQHYNHRSHEHEPIMALSLLCKLLPNHPNWTRWYHSIVLYTEYCKQSIAITSPYEMSPASIYHEDEADKDAELFLKQQAFAHPGMLDEYKEQVRNGMALGKGYYLRRYPIWFSYRGNSGLVLGTGNALSYGASIRNDYELEQLAQRQLEWIVGKNPFGQSLMLGEGYNYAAQYVCLPGSLSGSLCVGIQSYRNEDVPYWPQSNNAVYREMWIHPSVRYLLLASHINRKSKVYGWLSEHADSSLRAVCMLTEKEYSVQTAIRTGEFSLELPSGQYMFYCDEKFTQLTLVNGSEYELTNEFNNYTVKYELIEQSIHIEILVTGDKEVNFECRANNVQTVPVITATPGHTTKHTAVIESNNKPWILVLVPDGIIQNKIEIRSK
ncbi:glycoside hydrolase family 9 protein [Paenibacillus endoradicis]|uniref:glycoside hydrolase family 9 protein n=1 Tax=Paenibacillus endoradicis TaxID=2972487 RepID=UPI002158DB8E|nr:glycoside hydrolase family 9 protein [Paenibacillus endoradicis]MCR8660402.1 glycoside hydrolase family 9 protein [Paenibacillus endoradicis]